MVLVKNVKFGHVFIFGKISKKNVFDNILETKNALKTRITRSLIIGIFAKGLVHGFGQKCKFGHVFIFPKISQKKVFEYILKTKNAFKTIKTRT